ncbi:flavodoxin [Schinkia azotoformans]|uniref:Flavodoxin n=1 Tax=Schinkia azotoformans LMG 9581 TaxID=1131731 RepID=K6DUU1_SCHAZ|nr:flavodoxin [Schinkia azotoformans]EKN64571.1 flavodoxin, short chain [Schinkia azotoformans LMG 9581]MEC1637881.1 flavodoxin [Schinkia azotoformans]MEC1944777.1 flavodoxin [Schinkia azotoformans]
MEKILMVYCSMTGNTETIAGLVEEGITESGFDIIRKDALEVDAHEINDYETVILGSYTWGDGEIPDEFLDFCDGIRGLDFTGKKFAVFGSGDTSYDDFCGAVDIIEKMIEENGGIIALESLKVEQYPDENDEERCKEFGKRFAESVNSI